MVAYDLDTGKELWKAPASDPIQYFPLRETGSERLLVYVTEATKKPKLVEFDPKNGAMTTVAEYPKRWTRTWVSARGRSGTRALSTSPQSTK
ncbi:hypothetical protein [Streptomyces sp. NPDC050856]|uniref:hypothetical protein n=1 Tax=Streptomyces sp. NPDC050856 TaxID=3154939 RepID=UPI0033DD66C1